MLIDSHCHLSFKDYADEGVAPIIQRALDAGVTHMITIGAGEGIEGNAETLKIANQYENIFCTVGIHPHDARLIPSPSMGEGQGEGNPLSKIKSWAQDPKVVAIGEIGLDFHYNNSPQDKQIEVLHQLIDLALELKKPIMIHDRDARDLTYNILKEHGVKENQVMIHCFTGTMELAKKYLDLGCYLSFTGIITFPKAKELQDIVQLVPIECTLVETDAPFLAPVPHRGKKNEPAFVTFVAQKIAELKNLSFDDVARITSLNAKRFFNLPLPELEPQIAYTIRDSLYLNITNRCTLACTFCPKFVDYEVKGYYLKLPKEPTVDEALEAIGDASKYKEVVFCGYGEPTRRLDALLEISKKILEKYPNLKLRLNSDGLGNLVHGRNIIPQLAKYFHSFSISLNAADAKTYAKYCPSKYKESAYPAVKEFIREAVKQIPEVIASVVGLPDIDREACRKIAEELGAKFRYREYNQVG